MTRKIINGKEIAQNIKNSLKKYITSLEVKHHLKPGIAVIIVGENEASMLYVRNKIRACQEVGISFHQIEMPSTIQEDHLVKKIESLNNDPKIHGILVQLPLPKHIDTKNIIDVIAPEKDVDGFHPYNMGNLLIGNPSFVPCTPLGCLILLKAVLKNLESKKALVIGRSQIVGKPMAALLSNQNCTVTLAHSKTLNLKEEAQKSDIIVAAVGVPRLVKSDWVKEGAIILDVGINSEFDEFGNKKLIGDVDFENVKDKCYAISPVPGGVGPMTIACLLSNTVKAACLSRNIEFHFIVEDFLE